MKIIYSLNTQPISQDRWNQGNKLRETVLQNSNIGLCNWKISILQKTTHKNGKFKKILKNGKRKKKIT